MAEYRFLFYFRGSSEPVTERRLCESDGHARGHAVKELLRMPSRLRAEVWCGERQVYVRGRALSDRQEIAAGSVEAVRPTAGA